MIQRREQDLPPFRCEVARFEGPIAWEGLDDAGNWHCVYESGAHAVVGRGVLEDYAALMKDSET